MICIHKDYEQYIVYITKNYLNVSISFRDFSQRKTCCCTNKATRAHFNYKH